MPTGVLYGSRMRPNVRTARQGRGIIASYSLMIPGYDGGTAAPCDLRDDNDAGFVQYL